MKDKIVSARRTVDLPWVDDGRYYELSTGRRTLNPSYVKSAWAYACMHIRGTELANLPWQISRNGKPLKRHAIKDMLEDFGAESNYHEAMQSTEIDLCMWGAAYWLRDIDQLRRLNPQTMKVIKTRDGISGFEQKLSNPDGGEITNHFNRDEIIYFREYNPDDDLGEGIAVMEVLKGPINTEYEVEQLLQAHFKNDAIPGLLLTTDQAVPDDEASRILAWWNKRFRGSRKAGSVGVADKGLKAQILSSNMRDNAIIEVRDMARNDICVGFRVPKILIGSMSEATYANANESRKFMIEDLILPRSQMYANFINQDLVQKLDPGVMFEFVPEELPILQEDSTAKEARLASMFASGIISAEFYREEMGIEESAAPTDETIPVEKSWEKKALKAFTRSENINVPFETDVIPIDRQYVIRARLGNAKTEQDIREAFKR
jgi:HK97 family phage portal protein